MDRKGYLVIQDICTAIGKGVSVARLLVREMEAAGDLVIVLQGFRRLYFRDWPKPSEMPPKAERAKRVREERSCFVMLTSPEERRGNTRMEECRRFNGINLRVTQLLRQASQQAA
jgi:hypothetical protein